MVAVIWGKDDSDVGAGAGGRDGKGERAKQVSLRPGLSACGCQDPTFRGSQIPPSRQIIERVLAFCFLKLLSKTSNNLLVLISARERAFLPVVPVSVWRVVVDIVCLLYE